MPYMFKHFQLVLDPDPDFVIMSVFKRNLPDRPGSSYMIPSKKRRVRILYTPENIRPNIHKYDWVLSYDYKHVLKNTKQFRLPFYTILGAGENLLKKNLKLHGALKEKTRFCAFVYSHGAKYRDALFKRLSQYKKIDSPGRSLNNMQNIGGYASCLASRKSLTLFEEKLEFLRQYKFVIAYENESTVGYTTEKIYHALLARTVPIYWGNPLVHKDFNSKRFINRHNFSSTDAMINKIIELDNNNALYARYLREPCYPNNKLTPYVNPKRIISIFRKIFRV